MTNKELRYLIQRIKENKYLTRDETNYIIKALEQEPCGDAISRKDTLKKFKQIYFDNDIVIRCAELILGSMPPVTPQQKTGHWIQVDSNKCKCDQCEIIQFIAMYPNGSKNYCPNCGAKMVEPQERSEVQE